MAPVVFWVVKRNEKAPGPDGQPKAREEPAPVVLLQKGTLEPDSDPRHKLLILEGLDGAP